MKTNPHFCICLLAIALAACNGWPKASTTANPTTADTTYTESAAPDSLTPWQQELQTLVRLYEAAEPEQTASPMQQWCRVDIDDDGFDEVLLRSADKRYGAFFTVKDKPALICTESPQQRAKLFTGRIRTSKAEGRSGFRYSNYIIKNSSLAHTFVKFEVYGEMRECKLDGRPLSYDDCLDYQETLSRQEQFSTTFDWFPIE